MDEERVAIAKIHHKLPKTMSSWRAKKCWWCKEEAPRFFGVKRGNAVVGAFCSFTCAYNYVPCEDAMKVCFDSYELIGAFPTLLPDWKEKEEYGGFVKDYGERCKERFNPSVEFNTHAKQLNIT